MKKMIIGLVIGLMLGMSTNAFAAIGDKVQAIFAEFNYVVNDEIKVLDSPVLVYEGSSYVRTTQISNLLGYDVTYKSDSRTIEFYKPEPVPTQTITPNDQPITPTPDKNVDLTTTPVADPTPTPLASVTNTSETPSSFIETTPLPATIIPSPTPSPTVVPTSTPAPSNVAQCQAIRDNYGSQIAMVGYEGGAEGPQRLKVLGLQNQMSAALSSAGC